MYLTVITNINVAGLNILVALCFFSSGLYADKRLKRRWKKTVKAREMNPVRLLKTLVSACLAIDLGFDMLPVVYSRFFYLQIRGHGGIACVDAEDPLVSNWMRYVNCSLNLRETNLAAFQYQGQIYYRTLTHINR